MNRRPVHLCLVALVWTAACVSGSPTPQPARSSPTPQPAPSSRSARVPVEPYYEYEVNVPAQTVRAGPLVYPDSLRQVGAAGTVHMHFVVDTLGRAEPGSVRLLNVGPPPAGAGAFADAARASILGSQYRPAQREGRKVRQIIQQAFAFQRP